MKDPCRNSRSCYENTKKIASTPTRKERWTTVFVDESYERGSFGRVVLTAEMIPKPTNTMAPTVIQWAGMCIR